MATNATKKKDIDNNEMKLSIGSKEFIVGSEFLQNMVSNIPDTPLYKELFHELAKSNNEEVRNDIAWKDSLSEKTIKILLDDKSEAVLDRILNNTNAQSIVTNKQLISFIDMGNTGVVKTIIQNLSDYEEIDIDEAVQHILDLNDPGLTLTLASGWNVPKKILKKLATLNDLDIAYAAKKSLE